MAAAVAVGSEEVGVLEPKEAKHHGADDEQETDGDACYRRRGEGTTARRYS